MDKILEQVVSLISKVLNVKESFINPDSSGDSIEQWDSLAHATIIAKVEDHFDIKFDVMDIIQMRNVEDIVQNVKQYLK